MANRISSFLDVEETPQVESAFKPIYQASQGLLMLEVGGLDDQMSFDVRLFSKGKSLPSILQLLIKATNFVIGSPIGLGNLVFEDMFRKFPEEEIVLRDLQKLAAGTALVPGSFIHYGMWDCIHEYRYLVKWKFKIEN